MSIVRSTCVSIAIVLMAMTSAQAAAPGDLIGLWRSVHAFGPSVSGRLTIRRTASGLRAAIAGRSVSVEVDGTGLRFTLPDNQGRFRGRRTGAVIRGFWIQPATETLGVEHASPLVLRRARDGAWRATVVPLKDQLTLFLQIDRQPDGALGGFLRNPELNFGRGRALAVSVAGDAVGVTDPVRHQTDMHGTYEPAAQRLTLTAAPANIAFVFARVDSSAPGFAPRPSSPAYSYHPPRRSDDGWRTGSLTSAGIAPAPIAALIRQIADTKPAAGAPYIDSLLIARHGRLVLEEYFDGFDRDTPHALRSASKSVTSMLLGAAIDHGAPVAPSTPVASLLGRYRPFANPDPRKERITVEDLLTMRSGLACDDDDGDSPGNEDNMQNQSAQPDWYKYALDLPMVGEPGDKAAYCSAGVNLVGGAIGSGMGRWLPDVFEEYLAAPLQIRHYYMNLMPTGEAYGGGGLYVRPRDALKFGQLYLDGGLWNGRRVVSRAWIAASTAPHATLHPDSAYGYNWWLYNVKVGDRTYDEWAMGGNGGQIVAVIPALDVVIGFTASNYGRFDIWSKFQNDLIPNVILPAVAPGTKPLRN